MRDTTYRTIVRIECHVDDGDAWEGLIEARDAVAVTAANRPGANVRHQDVHVHWERTDEGITVYTEISSTTGSPPVFPRGSVHDNAHGDPVYTRAAESAPGPEGS